jgi:hypothetical protein
VTRSLLALLMVMISLCGGALQGAPARGNNLSREDVKNFYLFYKRLLHHKQDLLDSTYGSGIDSNNSLCLVDLIMNLDEIEKNIATAFYLSILASEIKSPSDQRATTTMLQSSTRDASKGLAVQRNEVKKILDRCASRPLVVVKVGQVLALIGQAEAALRALTVRLYGAH